MYIMLWIKILDLQHTFFVGHEIFQTDAICNKFSAIWNAFIEVKEVLRVCVISHLEYMLTWFIMNS